MAAATIPDFETQTWFPAIRYAAKNLCQKDILEKKMCERSLWQFVQQAWPVVEPDEFVPGWHIEAICQHLEAVTRGKIKNLIINVPPRHTKSLITSVLWPAWEWGPAKKPSTRWLCISYGASLSLRDSVKCRTLLQSRWFRERWGGLVKLQGDQNAKERYNNSSGGSRVSSSVGGIGTGEGGERLVIDDPHNVLDVQSETALEYARNWWNTVMPTRKNDPKKSSRVVIMQRSHPKDICGVIKETSKPGEYEWLVLPARFEPDRRCRTNIGFVDPRKEEGELLWPARFGEAELAELERALGSYAAAGQLQQRPAPLEGGILKRDWWQYYPTPPIGFDFMIQSWDMAFKDLKSSDYVCGQVWGVKGSNKFLLDRVCAQLDFVRTLQAVRRLTLRWSDATAKYVEDKANGTAVINTLKNEIPGLIPFNPEGSKEARAFAVSPEIESGNVWLPCKALAPWIDDWVETMANFPRVAHDDDVDAMTQALLAIRKMARTFTTAPIISATRTSMWDIR